MGCWSGALEWSGVKFWSEKVSCFVIYSDKDRTYFRKYQEHKLSFCMCGCEFLSDLIDLYFWGNHNGTKAITCNRWLSFKSGFILNCMSSEKGPFCQAYITLTGQ